MARLSVLAGQLHLGQSPFPLPSCQQSIRAAGLRDNVHWGDPTAEVLVVAWRDQGYYASPMVHQARQMFMLGDTLSHLWLDPEHPSHYDRLEDFPCSGLGRAVNLNQAGQRPGVRNYRPASESDWDQELDTALGSVRAPGSCRGPFAPMPSARAGTPPPPYGSWVNGSEAHLRGGRPRRIARRERRGPPAGYADDSASSD